jgi:hypothetical protein
MRRVAIQQGVAFITTLSAAAAVVNGIRAQRERGIQVSSLQELHQKRTSLVPGSASQVSNRPLGVAPP